ncbi:MAG: hypothetical protein COA99_03665 [Moraxellaceae bacterium]|nr:MAG: hypothetical protein COA99_03665 [Moraxellaceae bacterium]
MNEVLLFSLTIAIIAYWWYGTQCRETAIIEAKRLCGLDGLQFLDQTVELTKQWPSRNKHGSVCYCRSYTFEFTTTGEQRYQGRILIISGKIVKSDLDVYRIEY